MKQKKRDLPGNKWITNGAKKHYPLIYHQKQLQSQLVESNLPLPYYICGDQCSKRKKSSNTHTHFGRVFHIERFTSQKRSRFLVDMRIKKRNCWSISLQEQERTLIKVTQNFSSKFKGRHYGTFMMQGESIRQSI